MLAGKPLDVDELSREAAKSISMSGAPALKVDIDEVVHRRRSIVLLI